MLARVRIESVTKSFGDSKAIDNVTLEVRDGAFVSLLGPSGAGKTTLLRCIAGLEKPEGGSIYVGDDCVNDVPPQRRGVAMLFQSYALYPQMTVFDNIAFPLKKLKMPEEEIKRAIHDVAELLGIQSLLDRKPANLSGGEKQRVAIGRVIVRRPKVFLLDEPLTNLDAKLRAHMRIELKKIQERLRQTAIFATPDEAEALACTDEVAVMEGGKLLQFDTNKNVYDHPKKLFVAGFVGSPPMNFLDCDLMTTDTKCYLETSEFKLDVSQYREFLKDRSGRRVAMGVRPGDIGLSSQATDAACVDVEVYAVEPMGAETVIDIRKGEHLLKVKVPYSFKTSVGDKLHATFDVNAIHVFDKSTEEALF